MGEVEERMRREERGKRVAVIIMLLALVVFGVVWFNRW
jgi:hypothetical protein